MNVTLLIIVAIAYLIGSIPFGLLWARVFDLGDLRKTGSGNIGATNVLRTGNKKAAALTLVFDALKGAVPVLVAEAFYGPYAGLVAGLGAFLGHLYPVWLDFRGGKGVATFLGVMLAVDWRVGLAACATWLLVAKLRKISSLSALVATAITPPLAWWLDDYSTTYLAVALVAMVWMRHAPNIGRLLKGTEPKIGES